MKVDRMLRVNELIRRTLGEVIERDLSNYLPALLTVTQVKTAPDLHEADVSVSIMGTAAQRQAAIELLVAHRKQLQFQIGRQVKLKFTPVLRFHLDLTLEKAGKVLAIIDELKLADEPEAPAPEADSLPDRLTGTAKEAASDDPAPTR